MRKYQKGSFFPYLSTIKIPDELGVSNIISPSNQTEEGLDLEKYLGNKTIDLGKNLTDNPLSTSTTSGTKNSTASTPFDFTGALSSGIQLATGIKNIIESRKTKRQLKAQMKNFTEDFEQRKAELRNNDFYATPYTVGKFQGGGNVEDFMSWWENQQNNNNVVLETINKSYQDQNNALNAKWKQQKSSGIRDTIMGGVSLATKFIGFEEGGEFESLYSEQFVSPFEKELEETKSSEIQQELEWDDLMSNWLLEESKTSNEVSLNMSDLDHNVEHKHTSLPISPILIELKKLGINPSSVTGGKHNVGSSHSLGRSVDLGLNTSFGGDKRRMEEFLTYYNSVLKPKYPNLKLLDERQKPVGQKVWSGSHYHLELK